MRADAGGRAESRSARACLTSERSWSTGAPGCDDCNSSHAAGVVREQPVAPLLDLTLAVQPGSISVAPTCKRGTDRFRIDLAHELADELPLPHTGTPARDVTCRDDRVVERLGQIERIELRRRQRDQRLAERLQIERLAFARALARRLVGIAVGRTHARNASTQGLRGGHC